MRAVASLETAAMSRATIMAMTRSRQRLRGGPSMRSRPMLRSVPSTAATWPFGTARRAVMLSRAAGDDPCLIVRRHLAALEQGAQSFDDLGRPIGQVGNGALLDLAGVAIALAQQDRGRRVSVGDRFDIHGTTVPQSTQNNNDTLPFTWLHFSAISEKRHQIQRPTVFARRKFGLMLRPPAL